VYSAAAGAGPDLFKVAAAGGVPQRIPTPFFASEPVSSLTRDLIAYMSTKREGAIATSTLGFVDLGNVMHSNLADPPGGTGFSNGTIAWSPDGHRLAVTRQVTSSPAELWIVDRESAQPYTKILEFPPGPRVRRITWNNDGTYLIIGKHDWTSDIVLVDEGK
jgi:Tol biopolymer transport system component